MKRKNNTGLASLDKPWLIHYNSEIDNNDIPNLTAYEYMVLENADNLNSIAIEYMGYKETFSKYIDNINKVAQAFYNLGIRKGDVVTIMSITTPELEKTFYALNKIGAILNLIDVRADSKMIKHYLEQSNSKLLIVMENFLEEVNKIIYKTDVYKVITYPAYNSINKTKKILAILKNRIINKKYSRYKEIMSNKIYISWNDMLKIPVIKEFDMNVSGEKDLVSVYVCTGGTTGIPKTVMLTNYNLNAMAYQYKLFKGEYKKGETFLNDISPFVAYGIVDSIHNPTCQGLTNVIDFFLTPKEFTDAMIKYKPNHVLAVPTYWDNFVKDKRVAKMNLSFLKHAGSGGDSLSKEDINKMNNFFKSHGSVANIEQGYGMTEASSACAICIGSINKESSLGIPLGKTIVGIFEEGTDKEISYLNSNVGEICITGPNIMAGYLNNKEEENKVIKIHKDGKRWIHSGDLGYIDEEGFIHLVGRIKRMIIRGGFKIYPQEMERVITKVKGVDKCCVVSVPSKMYGQEPKVHILLDKEYIKCKEDVISNIYEICKKELPEYSMPCDIVVDKEFPLTSVGKVDYKKIELLEKEVK